MAVIVLRVLTTHVNVQFTLLVQVENSRIPVGARFQAPLLTVYDKVCKICRHDSVAQENAPQKSRGGKCETRICGIIPSTDNYVTLR